MTREELLALYQESPIPVYERLMKRFFGKYNVTSIVITTSLHNYQKAAIFFHELCHHHYEERYNHLRSDDVVGSEAYALTHGPIACANRGLVNSANWSVRLVLHILNRPHIYPYDDVCAAVKAIGSKAWRLHLPRIDMSATTREIMR